MQIKLLGGFEVVVDGCRVPSADWGRRQAAALVKLLALAPGRALHREQVVDALWPNLHPSEASPRLYKAAHYARRALRQPRSLVLAGDTVALFPDAEIDIDAVRFQRLAESARDVRTANEAADMYTGDLLPHDCYEAWTEEPRERLRLLYLRMLHRASRWQDIVNFDPTDESACVELVRGLVNDGDARSAQSHFDRLSRGLRELGIRPGAETVRLGDELADSLRRSRDEIVARGRVAGPSHPMIRSHGDWPAERVVEALVGSFRDHRALSAGPAQIAVVLITAQIAFVPL